MTDPYPTASPPKRSRIRSMARSAVQRAIPCRHSPYRTVRVVREFIFPSGVKVILNFAPEGDAAVNGYPVKKVAFMSFGTIGSAAKTALAPKSIDIAITSRLTRSTQKSPCPTRSLRSYLARNLLQAFEGPCWRAVDCRSCSRQKDEH